MSNSLYKITGDYLELMVGIEANEGVLTEDQEKELEISQGQLQSKSVAYLSVIKEKEALVNMVDEEIKRLQAVKKRNTTLIDTLNERLLTAVKVFGSFTVGTLTFGTRKSESVIVEDVNSLPAEFKTIKITELAIKAKIKTALKDGEEIEGCNIQENLNLTIK